MNVIQLDGAIPLTISKSILVSSTTAFFYYCITHLDDEVEFIWSRKWTKGKFMYLTTRYFWAIYLMFFNLCIINSSWLDPENGVIIGNGQPNSLNIFSTFFEYASSISYEVAIILAEGILQLRVYAIYGENKWLLMVLIPMNLCSLAICILYPLGYLSILNDLACEKGMFGCTQVAQNQKRMNSFTYATSLDWMSFFFPMPSLGWIVTSIFELVLFVFVLKKTDYNPLYKRRSNFDVKHHTPDVITILARDSTTYFVVIFSLSILGAIISFMGRAGDSTTYADLYNQLKAFQIATATLMVILAPQMLINIRHEIYNPSTPSHPSAMDTLTWDVNSKQDFNDYSVADTILRETA